MAHTDQVVTERIEYATNFFRQWVDDEPRESIQRLDSIQQVVDSYLKIVEEAAFRAVFERLNALAATAAGTCRLCGLSCERERKVSRVRTTRREVELVAWRYRCRACGTSRCIVREWLGLESGMTTAGFDRAVTSLATEMSFGSAANQMAEHHGHAVDRTLVERRTYSVGREAEVYLAERRKTQTDRVMNTPGKRNGAERVLVQVDSGAVPVGNLSRPQASEVGPDHPRTPVRQLPKGTRPKAKREVRVALAWQPGQAEGKTVDVHVAPHNQTEVTGDRMYCAALEAGMGDNTHVHGTFDMAPWQPIQFNEQFGAQPKHTISADYFHVQEYIAAATHGCEPEPERARSWTAIQGRRLKESDHTRILADLRAHRCGAGPCPRTDGGECAVKAAIRYIERNQKYMDYKSYIEAGLPIGSGEVEGRIRHIVRRRLDVPGDWRESNLALITALITIRQSGWWDDFWTWRDRRDVQKFQRRLRGEGLNRFRGPRKARPIVDAHESSDIHGFTNEFDHACVN
jgi:hypothetical protein